MKSYTKYKYIPLIIIISMIFSALLHFNLKHLSDIPFAIKWFIIIVVFFIVEFMTYRIDISEKEITVHKLFRQSTVIEFERITRIKFEGYFIRGRWLVLSLYDDELLLSAEIYSLCSKDFIKRIINLSSSNDCVIDLDKTTERLIVSEMDD